MVNPTPAERGLPDWAIAKAFREMDDCCKHSDAECTVYNAIFNRALELSRTNKRYFSVASICRRFNIKRDES